MAKAAKSSRDVAEWISKRDAKRVRKEARAMARQDARAKSFNSMTRPEKDEVLLLAAKMLGIIED